MGLLDGKTAVITGAGRGIGREHALHLASEGAAVVVNDIDGDEAAATVADDRGGRRRGRSADTDDVTTYAGADALVDQAVDDVRRPRRAREQRRHPSATP